MIKFKEVTTENFWEVINLEVDDKQKEFVVSNAVSIAQSKVQPECIPLCIYYNDLLIGFAMYCIDTDDDQYWIYRIMIDKKYQSKGYGKKSIQLLVERIMADKDKDKIYLGVHRESISAVSIYENIGFKFTGQVFGSEHIMVLNY